MNINASSNNSLWDFSTFLPEIDEIYKKTLHETGTSLKNTEGIDLKMESENPTGSVKDRGFCYQIATHKSKGITKMVISSTGNAAISAMNYAKLHEVTLKIFVSPRLEPEKLETLQNGKADIVISEQPLKDSILFSQNEGYLHLRQSIDPQALIGYQTLAFELYGQLKSDFEQYAVYFPVSSGTTLCGFAQGALELKKQGLINKIPQIHAVQTQMAYPIVEGFYASDELPAKIERSIAQALSSPKSHRKDDCLKYINDSKGRGWIVGENEIAEVHKYLLDNNINTSAEGAVAFVAAQQAIKNGWKADKHLVIVTGKNYGPS